MSIKDVLDSRKLNLVFVWILILHFIIFDFVEYFIKKTATARDKEREEDDYYATKYWFIILILIFLGVFLLLNLILLFKKYKSGGSGSGAVEIGPD
jgi:hypothetical protein